jgi:hypothetical protein
MCRRFNNTKFLVVCPMNCADGTPDLEEQSSNKKTVFYCPLDLENYKFGSLYK